MKEDLKKIPHFKGRGKNFHKNNLVDRYMRTILPSYAKVCKYSQTLRGICKKKEEKLIASCCSVGRRNLSSVGRCCLPSYMELPTCQPPLKLLRKDTL